MSNTVRDEDLIKQCNAAIGAEPSVFGSYIIPHLHKYFITGYRVCEQEKSQPLPASPTSGEGEERAKQFLRLKGVLEEGHNHWIIRYEDGREVDLVKLFAEFATPSVNEGREAIANDWIEIKEGNPLPDYDEYVLWYHEDGNMFVECLDKDGNPWIFGNEYEGVSDDEFLPTPKATHWRPLPATPDAIFKQSPEAKKKP
jgi:hypothetical protein